MKIGNQNTINASAIFGNEQENGIRVAVGNKNQTAVKAAEKGTNNPGGNISANGLRLGESDIEARKRMARNEAMKIVGDAFKNEKSMDASHKEMQDSIRRLNEDRGERKMQMKENNEKLAELRAQYGIEEGGEEDQELMKAVAKANSNEGLSSEEYDSLSEYQQRALYYMHDNQVHEKAIAEDEAMMAANVQSTTDLTLARLKDHSMIDAQKEADEIMDAADKEAIAMLTQDAMEHIDEKMEEEKEAAEKKAEEKEEEKKAEAKKEEKQAQIDELQARIRENGEAEAAEAAARGRAARQRKENAGTTNASDTAVQLDAQSAAAGEMDTALTGEVKNILNKLNLLSEDIKGAKVDDFT